MLLDEDTNREQIDSKGTQIIVEVQSDLVGDSREHNTVRSDAITFFDFFQISH